MPLSQRALNNIGYCAGTLGIGILIFSLLYDPNPRSLEILSPSTDSSYLGRMHKDMRQLVADAISGDPNIDIFQFKAGDAHGWALSDQSFCDGGEDSPSGFIMIPGMDETGETFAFRITTISNCGDTVLINTHRRFDIESHSDCVRDLPCIDAFNQIGEAFDSKKSS